MKIIPFFPLSVSVRLHTHHLHHQLSRSQSPVCMSAFAHSPLCHSRVISMRCRNVRISSFGLQPIRQDYPPARRGPSPRPFVSAATAHQADRSAAHPTPAAFPGFPSVSQPTKRLSAGVQKSTVKNTVQVHCNKSS